MAIPNHTRSRNPRKGDKDYPGTQDPHERDPGGNAIADINAHWSDLAFPSDEYTIEGGGLTAPSLIDSATINPVMRSDDSNKDWQSERAHADILYDEEYGYAGLGHRPGPEPTKPDDIRKDLTEFAAQSYKDSQQVRDVATKAVYLTYVIGLDALPILGLDRKRKRAYIKAPSANPFPILIGNVNTLPNVAGAGSFQLFPGDSITIENTDSLAAVLTAGTVIAAASSFLSVLDESYE